MHLQKKQVGRSLLMVVIDLVFMAQVRRKRLSPFIYIYINLFITGADIDTLCVFPKHVEREHFFTIMYDMLKARPEVTELSVTYLLLLLLLFSTCKILI